eukprot:gene24314-30635_t
MKAPKPTGMFPLLKANLSHLTVVTDDEVRVLAQNCPNLLSFVAIEAVYLSDQSLLYLAQYCVDIDHIDVSRSSMVFRITDTALSALGQKAYTLRTLKVAGCDQITDVGVTWLVEGCKALTCLDMGRCNRLTDAGLRNIGNSCHSLTHVDISHAKTVTDVGVSSLSAGCPNLRHLCCHGAFLLSDPRLSAPTKGAKLESWQSVIGIAALANNCHSIEHLDLSGCFRLNIALHSYISSLKYVKVLNLSGCNQSSVEAMEAVARGCTLIEDLTLTDCGKSVNNKSIKAFTHHCKNLTTLIAKKGKWKELFDEKQQKRFFYNKLSGEIRYRMPQDLLDLIPHPNFITLGYISYFSSTNIVCNELFCQTCFNTVHSGGRRAEHPFRALYDYYNKRLDYGDGVFPCKWPSEVMQDEVQGWMLRIAPIRNPTKTYQDGWEVYNENTADANAKKHSENYKRMYNTVNTGGNSGENRLFYFNRLTFETTYETPPSILQEQQREALKTANNTVIYSTGYYDASNMWIEDTRPNTFAANYAEGSYGEYNQGIEYGGNQTPYTPYTPYTEQNTSFNQNEEDYFGQQIGSNVIPKNNPMPLGSARHYTSGGMMNTQQFNAHYSEKNPVIDVNYNYSISDNEPSVSVSFQSSEFSARSMKRDQRLKNKPSVVNRKLFASQTTSVLPDGGGGGGGGGGGKDEIDFESVNFGGD